MTKDELIRELNRYEETDTFPVLLDNDLIPIEEISLCVIRKKGGTSPRFAFVLQSKKSIETQKALESIHAILKP